MRQAKYNNPQHEIYLFKRRVIALSLVLLLVVLIIVARLIELQIIHHKKYTTLSQQNVLNTIPIAPNRGLIYDRNGILLAQNIPTYSLGIIPAKTQDLNHLISKLQQLVPISSIDIKHFKHVLKQYHRYDSVPLKIKISEQQAAMLYVNRYRLSGINIQATLSRHYLQGAAMTPVIGYVGRINEAELQHLNKDNYLETNYIGKSGIEKFYENTLHGTVGVATVEINANGEIVRYLRETPPIPGQDLHLTVDSRLQQFIYQQLGNNSGAAVAINPRTGAILAMVSKPSFDANLFSSGISQQQFDALLHASNHPLYNRATRGLFSPGSTIKPFYALAALSQHIINPNSRIFDPGWFRLPKTKHIYHDWKHGGHGWVDVNKAIIVSCDTFFYELAVKMGITLLDRTLHQFGFGDSTNTDTSGELQGIVPSPSWKEQHQQHPWYTGDTIITGIGQGSLLVTPLQLAEATAILANRGVRVQPHLVKQITTSKRAKPITLPAAKTLAFNASKQNWNIVIRAMQGVISDRHGTAINFGQHNFSVAGKTGTAQVFGKNRNEEYDRADIPKRLRNNHLFIAFAPVKHPSIALAVIVEHAGTTDRITNKILKFYFNESNSKTQPQGHAHGSH